VFQLFRELFIIRRMRMLARKLFSVCAAAVLASCTNAPVEYDVDQGVGYLHDNSTDPADIFRNKVDHEAALEARGIEPPVGNASWREYWAKLIAYFSGEGAVGTHREVASYVFEKRRALGLRPL
jgi:hypothetical protein